jgi:hypothetical protein
MIKALLLIIFPAGTWDGIVASRRSWPVILIGYLFPLWLIAAVAEWYGLVHWGKPRGEMGQIKPFLPSEALVFEVLQVLLMLVIVFVGARMIKSLGETFHGRHTFVQAFTVTAYGLSPVFALRVLDILPVISSWGYWATWVIGMVFCFSILYHGIPKVMQPDPPHAFGLYLVSGVLLGLVSGLVRFLTFWYLEGKFVKLNVLITKLVDHLPFLQSLDQHHF